MGKAKKRTPTPRHDAAVKAAEQALANDQEFIAGVEGSKRWDTARAAADEARAPYDRAIEQYHNRLLTPEEAEKARALAFEARAVELETLDAHGFPMREPEPVDTPARLGQWIKEELRSARMADMVDPDADPDETAKRIHAEAYSMAVDAGLSPPTPTGMGGRIELGELRKWCSRPATDGAGKRGDAPPDTKRLRGDAALVFDLLWNLPDGKAMTGVEIIDWVHREHGITIEESTLTSRVIPRIKRSVTVKNERPGGYFIPY